MELVENYKEYLRNYTNFSGTATRKEFWLVWLCNFILSMIIGLFFMILGVILRSFVLVILQFLVFGVVGLALLLPSIAITMRRLHDAGFSGWFILVSLIPVIGGLALMALCLVPSRASNTGYMSGSYSGYQERYTGQHLDDNSEDDGGTIDF